MTAHTPPHSCPGLDAWIADANIPIAYEPRFREFVIAISDSESIVMTYCPSCGTKLPASLRDEWFDRIFDLDLSGPEDPGVPDEMRTDEWWRRAGL